MSTPAPPPAAAPAPNKLLAFVLAYAKAHTALLGALATWALAQYGPHLPANYLALIVAVLTAAGVAVVPNKKT